MIDFGLDEDFINNYEVIKNSYKMAELYNCSRSSIANHCKKIGYIPPSGKNIKISNLPVSEVIEIYEKTQNLQKTAQYFSCSPTAVRNYLQKNNYTKIFYHTIEEINEEEFIAKYEELKSAKKVGEYFGYSSTAILNYAKKIGYNVNSNKNYKLDDEDKQFILNNYEVLSSTNLAKIFNVSRGMITKIWYDSNKIGKKINTINTSEIDITGQIFNHWTVLHKAEERTKSGGIYWYCRCSCGKEKNVSGLSLRNGTSMSCGHTSLSKGNETIAKILTDNNISFEREKKFITCRDSNELPFDFFVENEYLIEFDGIQHFTAKGQDWNTKEKFFITQKHDKIKNEWCKKNNITLIRIPYIHLKRLCLEDLLPNSSRFIVE